MSSREEITYIHVGERIYHEHDDIVVGRVDCFKYPSICAKYHVQVYPTVYFLNKAIQVKYIDDFSYDSIISFAERQKSANINTAISCDQLERVAFKYGLIIVTTLAESTNENLHNVFETVAKQLKPSYWFYQFKKECKHLNIKESGIYILKKQRKKAIEFDAKKQSESNDFENLERSLKKWIRREWHPVYGEIVHGNFGKYLESGRLIVVALLDEYKPAKRFTALSEQFDGIFRKVARKYAHDEDYLFAWTSDVNLANKLTFGATKLPCALLLKPDLSYHLVFPQIQHVKNTGQDKNKIPEYITEQNLTQTIEAAKNGKIIFEGGSSYLWHVFRETISLYNILVRMYSANPVLTCLIFGFPAFVLTFVIFSTCYLDRWDDSNEKRHLKVE